jgi:hypothetical protein
MRCRRGRGKIVTGVRPPSKLPEAAKFIREQLEAGRQCYIVYPLIEESEKLEAKAAAAEFAKWSELLAPMKCELLHGRVPPEEKDAIMGRFRAGQTKALIATTVIEVGVDVPECDRDADRKRGTLRPRAITSAPGPHRARHAQELLRVDHRKRRAGSDGETRRARADHRWFRDRGGRFCSCAGPATCLARRKAACRRSWWAISSATRTS